MDAKSSHPSSSYEEEEESLPPPSYAESQISGHHPQHASFDDMKKKAPTPSQPTTHQTYSSQIQQQLSDLTHSITSIQSQRSLLTTAHDEKILALLTLEIRTYLAAFAASGLRVGQLILVPTAALQEEGASPMSCDVRDPTAFNRFARVIDEENRKVLADHERARREYGYGFDEEVQADLWFWDDEKMARRLAGYLRPEEKKKGAAKTLVELPPRPQAAGDADGEKKGRWGWRKKKQETVEEVVKPVEVVLPKEDSVVMDIRGQEVCFEVENDCGVLESRTGYGIVMKLRVTMSS